MAICKKCGGEMREYRYAYRIAWSCPACRKARDRNAEKTTSRKWAERHPEKRRAQLKVNYAIKCGLLEKGSCVRCGSTDAQAHHDNYARPLAVIWLCPLHHAERHRNHKAISTVARLVFSDLIAEANLQ